MQRENHVVSLELSKKLQELGVKQESIFRWVFLNNNPVVWTEEDGELNRPTLYREGISAFLVSELAYMLLKTNYENISKAYYFLHKRNDVDKFDLIEHIQKPDFNAKMLIYLLENNLIQN